MFNNLFYLIFSSLKKIMENGLVNAHGNELNGFIFPK